MITQLRCGGYVSVSLSKRRSMFGMLAKASVATCTTTHVRYAKKPSQGKPFIYLVSPPEEVGRRTNIEADDVQIAVKDLRDQNNMHWQRNGFELVKLSDAQAIDWDNIDQVCSQIRRPLVSTTHRCAKWSSLLQVKAKHYPEVEAVLKQLTGASRVQVMMHGLRRGKTPKE